MNNNFTKKDLKPGYLVEYRDGCRRLVMQTNDKKIFLTGEDGYTNLSHLHDDLCYFTNKSESFFDIVKVWGLPKNINTINKLIDTKDRDLLWAREEPKEMTIEEIEQALGYSIKIVKEQCNGKGN